MAKQRTLREQLASEFLQELAVYEEEHEAHTGEGGPLLAQTLVQDAARARASDIHVEQGNLASSVRFRIDGVMLDVASITKPQSKWVINQFKALANLDPVVSFTPKDAHAACAIDSGPLDLRLALTPSATGEALSVRLLDPKRLERSIDDLGLTDSDLQLLENWAEESAGMFLAAGPTGSGKTTTIYSLLHLLKTSDRAIVTLEDPVEYQIDGIVQVQLDLRHHLNFGEGIKSMLRLDPDYLMLGEIRDAVSARAAVDAAISGRVLLSTLHCRDAVGAVTALRNWGLLDHEIAEALSVVVSQRLVRRLCDKCRRIRAINEKERRWLESLAIPAPKRVSDAPGCTQCAQLGFAGRTGVFELWRLNEQDYEAILAHADEHSLRKALSEREHHPILADGLVKLTAGVTSVSELRRAVTGSFLSQQLPPLLAKPHRANRTRLPAAARPKLIAPSEVPVKSGAPA